MPSTSPAGSSTWRDRQRDSRLRPPPAQQAPGETDNYRGPLPVKHRATATCTPGLRGRRRALDAAVGEPQARLHHKRDSIKAHLTIVFAALAASPGCARSYRMNWCPAALTAQPVHRGLAVERRGAAALSTALNSNALNVAAGLLLPAAITGLGAVRAGCPGGGLVRGIDRGDAAARVPGPGAVPPARHRDHRGVPGVRRRAAGRGGPGSCPGPDRPATARIVTESVTSASGRVPRAGSGLSRRQAEGK
jgi:hypothetical protein